MAKSRTRVFGKPSSLPAQTTASLSAAEAWCWVARLLREESDALYYAYPRTFEMEREGAVLSDQSEAAYRRAEKLGASVLTWQSALTKWDAVPEERHV